MKKLGDGGFTLIELLGVISVIGVISMLAIPVFKDDVASYKKNADVRRVISMIKYAQSKAVSQGREWQVDFDDSGGAQTIRTYPAAAAANPTADPQIEIDNLDNLTVTDASSTIISFEASGLLAAGSDTEIEVNPINSTGDEDETEIEISSTGRVTIEN